MATIEERIAALEAKLKQEKAKKQQIEARKRALSAKRSRQQDTRRKILAGAAVLAAIERGDWPQNKLLALLDAMLTRADDRALFDLPSTPTPAKPQEQQQATQAAAPSQPQTPPAPPQPQAAARPAEQVSVSERADQLREEAIQRSRSTGKLARVYLDVPYDEREAAKAVGADFDAAVKRWYIGIGIDKIMAAQRWWPKA